MRQIFILTAADFWFDGAAVNKHSLVTHVLSSVKVQNTNTGRSVVQMFTDYTHIDSLIMTSQTDCECNVNT